MKTIADMIPYWGYFLISVSFVVVYFLKLRYFNIYQKIVYFTFGSSFGFMGLDKLGERLLWSEMWHNIFSICAIVLFFSSGIIAMIFSRLMKKK